MHGLGGVGEWVVWLAAPIAESTMTRALWGIEKK